METKTNLENLLSKLAIIIEEYLEKRDKREKAKKENKRNKYFLYYIPSDKYKIQSMEAFLTTQKYTRAAFNPHVWSNTLLKDEKIPKVKRHLRGVRMEYLGKDKMYLFHYEKNGNLLTKEIK